MSSKSMQIPIPASEYFNRKAIAALDMEIEAETGEDMIQKVGKFQKMGIYTAGF